MRIEVRSVRWEVRSGSFEVGCFEKYFLFSQSDSQNDEERIIPPIQTPEIVSSTPKYLAKPRPAPTATVQTGQTAETEVGSEKWEVRIKATNIKVLTMNDLPAMPAQVLQACER